VIGPSPPVARASARKCANTGNGTNDGTSTERHAPAQQPAMTDEEREAIQQVGAQDARRSRAPSMDSRNGSKTRRPKQQSGGNKSLWLVSAAFASEEEYAWDYLRS
jgi:hypothetical protein